ncbi:MAG: cupredoxin domain-containing protein [Thermoplasmata archaeon]
MTDVRARRLSAPVRRALPWLVAAALVATVGLPGAAAIGALPAAPLLGYGHPLAVPNSNATVNMTDTPAFTPHALSATPGANLSVRLVNQGDYTHTFTLSKLPNVVLKSTWTPAQLYAFFNANGSLANVSVAPGTSAWANVSFNSSFGGDSFEFVSVVPYQFQSGMAGFVNLSASGPGAVLSDNTTDTPSFTPDVLVANATHYPLIVDVLVTNQGNLGHTFTVSPLINYTLSPANFTSTFATNAPLVSSTVPSGPGNTVWGNFTIRAPGIYEYICTVAGHFAAGMYGMLYVGVPPPAPPVLPSTAIVEEWILIGSGVLLGIGVLVATVAAYSGRFPSKPGGHEGHS